MMRRAFDLFKSVLSYKLSKSKGENPCSEELCREREELYKRMLNDAVSFCDIDIANKNSIEFMEVVRT